jgi:class 3 adenylate cyclase
MASNPLKSIGDELMFFIPKSELKGETALSIFSALCNIIKIINIDSNKSYLREVKIGVAYCQQAYDITFINGTIDIYGKDIDLTSRLLSVARRNEIIMNNEFVEQIHKKYNMIENNDQFEEVRLIVGPWPQKFKGFEKSVTIYKIVI